MLNQLFEQQKCDEPKESSRGLVPEVSPRNSSNNLNRSNFKRGSNGSAKDFNRGNTFGHVHRQESGR